MTARAKSLAWGVMFTSFAVGALVALLGVHCLEIALETQILPPDEFPAAGFAYRNATRSLIITWSCTALFLVSAAFVFREAERPIRIGIAIAAIGQIVQPLHGTGSLVTVIGLLAVFLASSYQSLARHPQRDAIASGIRALSDAPVSRIFAGWAEVLLIPAVVLAVMNLVELPSYITPRLGPGFSGGDVATFAGYAAAFGFLAGLRFGVELLLMLLTARALVGRGGLLRIGGYGTLGFGLTMIWSMSWGAVLAIVAMLLAMDRLLRARPHEAPRLVALTLVTGLYIFARMVDVGLWACGDVLGEIDMLWGLSVLFAPIVLPMAIWTQRGLEQLFATTPPTSPAEVVKAIVYALLTPIGRPRLLGALPYVAAVVWFMLVLEYPEQDDYSVVGARAWTAILALALSSLVALLYLSQRRFLRGNVARGAVVALTLAALGIVGTLDGANTPREIAMRYSKMVRWSVAWVDHRGPAIEIEEAPVVEFARQETLPAGLLADERPPIVFILWDAVRADHTPAYGYARDTSPVLTRLASEGILFEEARSSATATGASLRHVFSGQWSSRYTMAPDHGPFFTGDLVARGYDRIYANVTGSDLNGIGLETFLRNQPNRAAVEQATIGFTTYHEPDKVTRALELLDERPSDRFFMFIHFLAPHYPWLHYDEVDGWGDDSTARYDESVAYTDYWTKVFLDGLRARGLYDKAVILITADHGTGLFDHGLWSAFEPYEEQIRVPLVMKIPGVPPGRVAAPVQGIDIAPTLVSLVSDAPAPSRFHGFSLLPAMAGEPLERRYSFHLAAFDDAFAMIDYETRTKLHVMRRDRYLMRFDLATDPAEQHNLADRDPEATHRMLDVARGWLKRGRGAWNTPYYYLPLSLR